MNTALVCATLAAVLALAAAQPAFVSIGDWGGAALDDYHRTDELAVAKQLAVTAANLDAEFVVNVGDNFYYYGVWNTSDPQFDIDFENVFTDEALMVKWYSVLGNHDYGFNPAAQIQYVSPKNNRWVMDSRYYTRRVLVSGTQYITFIFLDTNPCVSAYRADDPSGWDPCGSSYPHPADCRFHQNILAQSCTAQYTWLQSIVKTIPKDDWVIGVGHHVANEIDVEDLIGLLQGAGMDLYLNGHAHTLTYYHLDGKGAYVTTGAGCMVKIDGNDDLFEGHPDLATNTHTKDVVWTQKTAGFTTHQFSADLQSLTTNYISYSGETLHTFTVKRGQPTTDDDAPSNDDDSSANCKTYGCGAYNSDHKCQCNTKCPEYNNCCPDYKTVCESTDDWYTSLRH